MDDALVPDRKQQLSARIAGEVLDATDAAFDEVRQVWNGRFSRRPSLIARCASAADVAVAVRFAREHAFPISVRGGGHAYAGNTVQEGALLIDLGLMRDVEVDADARRASVGGGATWRDVDEATQAHGLATPGGTVSSVGVGGFTLGGGAGWLTRMHGMSSDNLLAAEVVTASGEVVRASADENPELYWGLRGGGGNFGVVTRFEYQLHEVGPEVYAGQVMYPGERSVELMRFFRDHMANAPDELMCFAFFLRVPPVDFFPEEYHGRVVLDFVLAWFGPVEDGEAALAPFRAHGDPVFDMVGPQPYVALQQSFDAGMSTKGFRWFSRAHYLDGLSDEAIEVIVARASDMPGDFTSVYLSDDGGAVGRVATEATAFPHRATSHSLHIFPGWTDAAEDDSIMAWTRAFSDAIAPHTTGAVYVNMLGDDEAARVPAAYGGNHERLARVKAAWDPGNAFRSNHNITPAG